MIRMFTRVLAVLCILVIPDWVDAAGAGDVEVRINGGVNQLQIGQDNTIEIWIQNDAVLQGMSVAFEFLSGRDFSVNASYGSHGYVNEEGDAISVWNYGGLRVSSEIDGISPDSILIGGAATTGNGLPLHATHTLCYTLQIHVLPGQNPLPQGFCIDNIFLPPAGDWAFVDAMVYPPTFFGQENMNTMTPDAEPYCFDICDGTDCGTSVCCAGATGNVNADATDAVDISDLTKLVNHLFVTFEPLLCPAEANTNGDAGCNVDISDLTRLVNHLFVTFEALAPCDPACD